jgi:Fic family protein
MAIEHRAEWTDRDLQEGLRNSPYSIPHQASEQSVKGLLDEIQMVTAEAIASRYRLQRDVRGAWLKRNRRIRELHESNRVEGLGPQHLSATKEILESKDADDIRQAMNRYAVVKALDTDQRTLDVLGLHGAKLFADDVLREFPRRPILEIDIRNMHALIMANYHFAGRYKQWLNMIAGAEHVPITPADTPNAMSELVDWLSVAVERQSLPPVVIAAVVHAWLAHVHPFDDGNGRVARLLANIVVGSRALPPLIVQMAADRTDYINALAISDVGGDLAPLIGVFLRIQKRAIADMRDPEFALRLFDDEIAERSLSLYTRWHKTFRSWLVELGAALRLRGLFLRLPGGDVISQETFRRIANGSGGEGVVTGGIGNEERYPECRIYLLVDKVQHTIRYSEGEPVLSFLKYGPAPWSKHVYRRLMGRVSEIVVRPDAMDGVYVRFGSGRTERFTSTEAAKIVAEYLADDFKSEPRKLISERACMDLLQ